MPTSSILLFATIALSLLTGTYAVPDAAPAAMPVTTPAATLDAREVKAATAAASTTSVVTVFLMGNLVQPLDASIISANQQMTAYAFACPPAAPACNFPSGGNVTVSGSSTYILTITHGAGAEEMTDVATCVSLNSESVACSETYGGPGFVAGAGAPASKAEVYSGPAGIPVLMMPLTVTAGFGALQNVIPTLSATTPTGTFAFTVAGSSSASATTATQTVSASGAREAAGRLERSVLGLVSGAVMMVMLFR